MAMSRDLRGTHSLSSYWNKRRPAVGLSVAVQTTQVACGGPRLHRVAASAPHTRDTWSPGGLLLLERNEQHLTSMQCRWAPPQATGPALMATQGERRGHRSHSQMQLARRMVEEAGRPRALVIREGSQQRPRAMLILTPELASYRQPHHLQPIAEECFSEHSAIGTGFPEEVARYQTTPSHACHAELGRNECTESNARRRLSLSQLFRLCLGKNTDAMASPTPAIQSMGNPSTPQSAAMTSTATQTERHGNDEMNERQPSTMVPHSLQQGVSGQASMCWKPRGDADSATAGQGAGTHRLTAFILGVALALVLLLLLSTVMGLTIKLNPWKEQPVTATTTPSISTTSR
ncbi:uncharacterized protein LOC133345033 [Lethenteron reissneri]|uniref:uncharacterized protein LOC133345033 n=1 Tax=Lethenteron reissneri TaxID=7753 RepID=UPI002AB6250D|nr:uncharacterized protein LOC133345033 [Lethenteron reissneri]